VACGVFVAVTKLRQERLSCAAVAILSSGQLEKDAGQVSVLN